MTGVQNFQCRRCTGEHVEELPLEHHQTEGGAVEEVRDFCYLGELLETDGGAGRAIRMRISSAWSKWREISSLLNNRHIPLVHRGRVYDACIRPVLIYGSETIK